MELQKINIKFFAKNETTVPWESTLHLFHSWIRESDGEYYDVADYTHVHAGPGIVLVAHQANVSMDHADGRLGLLYNQKQTLEGSNQEKLRRTFRQAVAYCQKIEQEPSLGGRLRFRGDEALFLVNDRLLAPNNVTTFNRLRTDLEAVAEQLFGGEKFSLVYTEDAERRFAVEIKSSADFEIQQLLANLE